MLGSCTPAKAQPNVEQISSRQVSQTSGQTSGAFGAAALIRMHEPDHEVERRPEFLGYDGGRRPAQGLDAAVAEFDAHGVMPALDRTAFRIRTRVQQHLPALVAEREGPKPPERAMMG
ncbi:hypothetical protein QFZ54_002979 [Sphingomonas faeni]|nr:hypothetical protein [Sphingomonas faeni]